MEERYCSECRAPIPKGESVCPTCGVFAGDVFDGRLPRRRRSRWPWFIALVVVAAVAAWMFGPWPNETPRRRSAAPVQRHAVKDQRDAMQTLRVFLTTSERDKECVALMAKGKQGDDYVIAAVDRCKHTQLGQFAVNAKTAAVTKR